VCAVGADQIAAADAAFCTAVDIEHRCGDAVGVLFKADKLAAQNKLFPGRFPLVGKALAVRVGRESQP